MAFNREQIDSTASDFDVNEINQAIKVYKKLNLFDE